MIIIADSGSTKTDWCVVNQGTQVKQITTEGTNPFFQTEEEISLVIKDKLLPHLEGMPIDAIYFYGAGCAFPEKNEIVQKAIYRHIPVKIEVGSDLLAAARSGIYPRRRRQRCRFRKTVGRRLLEKPTHARIEREVLQAL